jgi:hypothetical protein
MDKQPQPRSPGKPRDASAARQARLEREAAEQARARQETDDNSAAPEKPDS